MAKPLTFWVLILAAVGGALVAPTAQAASLSLDCRPGYGKLGQTPTFKLPVPPAPPIYVVTNPPGHRIHDNKKAGAPATWVNNPMVPAGARIFLDQRGLTGGATTSRWRVFNPLGQVVGDQRLDLDLEIPPLSLGGTYTLAIEGRATETIARDYTFAVVILPRQSVPMNLGATISGTIAVPGQEDEYAFTLSRQTLATFDSLTASNTLTWTLIGPGGAVVSARRFDLSDSTDFAVPVLDLPAGNYRLTVDGVGTAVGAYAFRLVDLASAPALTLDTAVNGELSPPNETDLYRFTAGAGQRVYVDLRSLSGPATTSRWL